MGDLALGAKQELGAFGYRVARQALDYGCLVEAAPGVATAQAFAQVAVGVVAESILCCTDAKSTLGLMPDSGLVDSAAPLHMTTPVRAGIPLDFATGNQLVRLPRGVKVVHVELDLQPFAQLNGVSISIRLAVLS
jgi:hypothetical protein